MPDVLREARRTSVVTIGPDTVRVCEPECRNYVLSELGIKGGRGGWVYKPSGSAIAHATWNSRDYEVTWKRCRPSALPCDQCGDEWMTRIPELVRLASERVGKTRPANAVSGLKSFAAHRSGLPGSPAYPPALDTSNFAPGATNA